jgi:aminomethyltransferase
MQQGRFTPLHEWHLGQGAKMAEFAGFDMPIEYTGVLSEHEVVRSAVGVFDVSHMGKIKVTGNALEWLNGILTNDLSAISDRKAQYSMLLNERGGVVDDLLAYRISESEIWLVPNASNAGKVFDVLEHHKNNDVNIENLHNDYCIFAIQGPESQSIVSKLGLLGDMDYMTADWQNFDGADILICRTGYTGEQGFELIVPNLVASTLWNQIIDLGVRPIGLGARDTLRLEMGYPLHGNDITEDITPLEAGLKWAVKFSKPNFLGKSALEGKPVARKRIALKLHDRGVPRGHMNVVSDGVIIGETTSGGYSPNLKVGIALALVDVDFNGLTVNIDVRGKSLSAQVVTLPFVVSSAR